MAGVRSPYLAPAPTPFPPTVRWSSCSRPLNLFDLKSKETFQAFFKLGMVARSWFLFIFLSPRRAYVVLHGPDNKHVSYKGCGEQNKAGSKGIMNVKSNRGVVAVSLFVKRGFSAVKKPWESKLARNRKER